MSRCTSTQVVCIEIEKQFSHYQGTLRLHIHSFEELQYHCNTLHKENHIRVELQNDYPWLKEIDGCIPRTTIEDLDKALNQNKKTSKRGKVLSLDGRSLTMLETKNENNLSYYQSIRFIKNQSGKKTIILGFDNVSRRYQFNDLSWLYDINFELLKKHNKDIKLSCDKYIWFLILCPTVIFAVLGFLLG